MQHNNTSTSAVLSSKLEKNLTPKKLDMGLKLYKMLFGFRVSKLNKSIKPNLEVLWRNHSKDTIKNLLKIT